MRIYLINLVRTYWILICIFLIALILRTHDLSNIPVGIHGDEASIGYNAYSLLKTGYDQNGKFLPLSIDQFGDFRPAGYHYIDIPFVALLGLNELSTRLPSALFGSFTVIIFYFLLFELFESKKTAIIGSAFLAISPWHFVISRATSEGVIAAFFIILGVYILLKGIKEKRHQFRLISLGFIFLFISLLFYHSARFFVPAILLPVMLAYFLKFNVNKKIIFSCLGLYSVLIISLLFLFSTTSGSNRPLDISIFNIPRGITDLKQQQDEHGTQNPVITRYFHNKLYFYGRIFMASYFKHFDGNFLFVDNGLPVRYNVPWSGNLYLIEIPFLLFGFAILFSEGIKSKKYLYLIPITWIFLGAIPAGLTWEDIPNIQRSSLMLYPLIMVSAFGVNEAINLTKKRVRIVLITVILLIFLQNSSYFFHNYFYHAFIHTPWHRSAAAKELVFTLDTLSKTKEVDKIVMTTQKNNNLILHLFYLKFDPVEYKKLGSPRESEKLKFKKFIITGEECPIKGGSNELIKGDSKTLYVNVYDCSLPKNAEILNTIRHPDGIPAYNIIKLHPFTEKDLLNIN